VLLADDGVRPGRARTRSAFDARNVMWLESTQVHGGPFKGPGHITKQARRRQLELSIRALGIARSRARRRRGQRQHLDLAKEYWREAQMPTALGATFEGAPRAPAA